MKLKKIISALLALTVVLTTVPVASAVTVSNGVPEKAYKGVDLSRWNGDVDFTVMKKRGVDFAILRCYSNGKDIRFDEYYEGAKAAGIDVGAYIFMYATTKTEAVKEANATIAALGGKDLDYPLFLDIEYDGLKKLSRSSLTSISIAELELFKKAGYETGIYCSKSFQGDYLDMNRLSSYYVWTAKWSLYSNEHDGKKYYFSNMDPYDSSRAPGDLWQFTSGGYGPYYGCSEHYLDLDYCYVDFKNKLSSSIDKDPEKYSVPERILAYNSTSMMRGNDVAWVQAVLYQFGYMASVDGVFGPMTKSAVAAFQKDYGLGSNGVVDSQTASKLLDVYNHRDYKATIKYNPSNGLSASSAGTMPYGKSFIPGSKMNFANDGYYLSGWTLYRASDKKYYCTNGKWHSASLISGGKYFKKIFSPTQKISIGEAFINTTSPSSDTFTFTAVWDTQENARYAAGYNGSLYSIFYGMLSFDEAKAFCAERGGSLAVISDEKELKALKNVLKNEDTFFVGASASAGTFKWLDGSTVSLAVKETPVGRSSYLTVSSLSLNTPATLFAVEDEMKVSGFIMESDCPHENIKIQNYVDTLCAKNGYSGDKVCADCGVLVAKGETVPYKGHTYGKYTVTKEATCKEAGIKEKTCEVCGYTKTAEIPKTDNHTFKTTVITKATTKANGKATDKCKVCGLKQKEYTVRKIGSVSLKTTSYAYTGEKIKPEVTVKDKDGKLLTKGTDYSVTYASNKYVGKAVVTITFKGKYEGEITKTFKIIPAGTKIYSAPSKNGKITLKWNKVASQSTGYVIEYSTKADFSKNVTKIKIKSPKTVTRTISGFKKGKNIYFRIRTYKTTSASTYYSKWSKTRRVVVK